VRKERIVDLITCPECGNAAEIQWRDVFESTDGPVEHAKVLCVERHHFLMPVASLAAGRAVPDPQVRQAI
jgi:hypothetical protein